MTSDLPGAGDSPPAELTEGALGLSRTAALDDVLAADRATRAAAAVAERWIEPYRQKARDAVSDPALDSLLREALKAIARALDADAVSILLATEDGSELVARAAFGLSREVDLELRIPAGSGLSGRVLSSRQPKIVDDLGVVDVMSDTLRTSGLHSFVGVPLIVGDRALGVLHATSRSLSHFGEKHAELLGIFGDPIASAIDRVRLFEAERAARRAAEEAQAVAEDISERLRGLQRITAALANADTTEEICDVVLDEAAPGDLDDGERAIWILKGSQLLLVHGHGLSAHYPEIPLDRSLPAVENLTSGAPLFVETRAELSDRWPLLADGPTAAFAALPLIAQGRPLGVMAVGFRQEHRFSPDERSYLWTIAEQAAAALARADARAALQEARDVADQRRDQLDFLAQASARLAASLDLEVTLQSVAELGVPRVADRCALYLVEGGAIRKQVLAPELNADERELFDSMQPTLAASSGIGAIIRTGDSFYLENVEDSMLAGSTSSPEHVSLLRRVGFGGMAILPLRARGRSLGALAFVNREGRSMPAADRRLAFELAARSAVAIDNALLYAREAEIARRLAATLLPSGLPSIAGLDIAARYEAGSAGLDIGGDFYDIFEIAPDAWLVAVGDVQGKGVEAAAVTALVRHTIRSAALSESTPAALLRHLNEVLIRNVIATAEDPEHPWDTARLCTAVLIRLDRTTRGWRAVVSCAGHPPPFMRQRNGAIDAIGVCGLLLGVRPDTSYEESVVHLEPGASLICFTDGLSDRPKDEGTPGYDRVRAFLRHASGTAQELTDALREAAFEHGPPGDDLVILAICLDDTAAPVLAEHRPIETLAAPGAGTPLAS